LKLTKVVEEYTRNKITKKGMTTSPFVVEMMPEGVDIEDENGKFPRVKRVGKDCVYGGPFTLPPKKNAGFQFRRTLLTIKSVCL